MIKHSDISASDLKMYIKSLKIQFGGHAGYKIYGHLNCASGKRMNKENRVFFSDLSEAQEQGYRPCGNCMRAAYKKWRALNA